jgi:hypothetical protein
MPVVDTIEVIRGIERANITAANGTRVSAGSTMTIRWAKAGASARGWQGRVVFTKDSTSAGCQGPTVPLLGPADDRRSAEFGCTGACYQSNGVCSWLLTAPVGRTLRLSVPQIDTQLGQGFVRVYNGSSAAAPMLLQASGQMVPSEIRSSSTLFVQWSAGSVVQGSGWRAVAVLECRQSLASGMLSRVPLSAQTVSLDGSGLLDIPAACVFENFTAIRTL